MGGRGPRVTIFSLASVWLHRGDDPHSWCCLLLALFSRIRGMAQRHECSTCAMKTELLRGQHAKALAEV